MRLMTILPLAAVCALSLGCQSRKFGDKGGSKALAAEGVPTAKNVTWNDNSRGSVSFAFFDIDPKTELPINKIERTAQGGQYSNLQFKRADDSDWGPGLSPSSDGSYAQISNSPWFCVEAETLIYGAPVPTKPGEDKQLCKFEIRTTGKQGEGAVILIGLNIANPNNRALDADAVKKAVDAMASAKAYTHPITSAQTPYSDVRAELNATASAGKVFDFKAFNPASPLPVGVDLTFATPSTNLAINSDDVADALVKVHNLFKASTNDGERENCLNNYRTVASDWTDLALHYWCQFPYDDRNAYVVPLLQNAGAASTVTDPILLAAGKLKVHQKTFAQVLGENKSAALKTISEDPQLRSTFLAFMSLKNGIVDFNVDQTQKAISKFYATIGVSPRSRRINDTYPLWLEEQPRYIDLRLAQKTTIDNWDVVKAPLVALVTPAAAPKP